MQIIVVGAGIAGLSTALALARSKHEVTILESAQALAEIGAGVQLTPNATRYFWKWGCGPDIMAISALPESFNVLNGANGNLLGSISFKEFPEMYGGPYLVIHRADIHRILHDHAVKAGVKIHLDSKVVNYGIDDGRVTLVDGTTHEAELVIAVDGIHSAARQVLDHDHPSLGTQGNGLDKTGWAAYRFMADMEKLKAHPGISDLVVKNMCNCATSDKSLIMTYQVKGSDRLNIVLSHPDDVDTSSWTQAQYRAAVEAILPAYGPEMRNLIRIAIATDKYQITNWPVYQVAALKRWTSDTGRLVLAGDAAHAMAFYLSMGVSMAVEDAAGLCECLDLYAASQGATDLATAMKLFESVRKPRAEMVTEASVHAGRVLQLPPGPQQDARNASLKDNGGHSRFINGQLSDAREYVFAHRYGIVDNTLRDWAYAYDVVQDVRNEWQRNMKRIA